MQNDAKYAVVGFGCKLAFSSAAQEEEHPVFSYSLENHGNGERLYIT